MITIPDLKKRIIGDITIPFFQSRAQLKLLDEVEEMIKRNIGICPVCKGTHGEWITKENVIKFLLGEKKVGE